MASQQFQQEFAGRLAQAQAKREAKQAGNKNAGQDKEFEALNQGIEKFKSLDEFDLKIEKCSEQAKTIPNQDDFMLSGFDEEENFKKGGSILKSSMEILQGMSLQLCPFCLKIVKEPPFKIVQLLKLKDKKFPVHQQCEESIVKLKNEMEIANTIYTFQQSESGSMFTAALSYQILQHSSHFISLEVQHPASTATIFTIKGISHLFYSQKDKKEFLKLDFTSKDLYQPQKYFVPLELFSLKAAMINLEEKTQTINLDMIINIGQFEEGTELELKAQKEHIGELKVCGTIKRKNPGQLNSQQTNNYVIPPMWFSPGTGTKVFEIITVEFRFFDHVTTNVSSGFSSNRGFKHLNIIPSPCTPPLSPHNASSPLKSPQRPMSPMAGCITPPQQHLSYTLIQGQIVQKVKQNKDWSMAVQTLLKKSAESSRFDEIQLVIEETKASLIELMKHHYGNYFSKTLVQICSEDQRITILQEIKDSFADIALDPQGSHVIQSLVESIKPTSEKEQDLVMQGITGNIVQMSFSPQGMHVINKIVNNFALPHIISIADSIIKKFKEIVKDKQGVCIVKSLMMRTRESVQKKAELIQLLKQDIKSIIIDKYGNYALQEALKIYSNEETIFISDYVLENLVQLAQNQLSSYIVELVLQLSKEHRAHCVSKITYHIAQLFADPFGKFVVNKVISLTDLDAVALSGFQLALNNQIAANPKAGTFYTSAKQQSPTGRNKGNNK